MQARSPDTARLELLHACRLGACSTTFCQHYLGAHLPTATSKFRRAVSTVFWEILTLLKGRISESMLTCQNLYISSGAPLHTTSSLRHQLPRGTRHTFTPFPTYLNRPSPPLYHASLVRSVVSVSHLISLFSSPYLRLSLRCRSARPSAPLSAARLSAVPPALARAAWSQLPGLPNQGTCPRRLPRARHPNPPKHSAARGPTTAPPTRGPCLVRASPPGPCHTFAAQNLQLRRLMKYLVCECYHCKHHLVA